MSIKSFALCFALAALSPFAACAPAPTAAQPLRAGQTTTVLTPNGQITAASFTLRGNVLTATNYAAIIYKKDARGHKTVAKLMHGAHMTLTMTRPKGQTAWKIIPASPSFH